MSTHRSLLVAWGDRHVSWPLLVVIEFVHKLPLEEIASEDAVGLRIVNCWHLEQEDFVWSLLSLYEFIRVDVEKVRVSQEFAGEPAEDNNVLTVSLDHATTLSLREQLLVDIDQSPWFLSNVIVSLNWIYVFSSLVSNTTEHKNCFVFEWAGWMIMSTHVEVWHLKP